MSNSQKAAGHSDGPDLITPERPVDMLPLARWRARTNTFVIVSQDGPYMRHEGPGLDLPRVLSWEVDDGPEDMDEPHWDEAVYLRDRILAIIRHTPGRVSEVIAIPPADTDSDSPEGVVHG